MQEFEHECLHLVIKLNITTLYLWKHSPSDGLTQIYVVFLIEGVPLTQISRELSNEASSTTFELWTSWM
jgi:hypothetical protein